MGAVRYEKKNGMTHIFVEAHEKEHEALKSIAKASYALARPTWDLWERFEMEKRSWVLTEEGAEGFIHWGNYNVGKGVAIQMDEVHGRKCSTFIAFVGEKHFLLDDETFQAFRGLPDMMLELAQVILEGHEITTAPLSTIYAYRDESLTLRLRAMGYDRLSRESDWDFRRRVFPEMHKKYPPRCAWEFLFGRSIVEWDMYDRSYYRYFGEAWDSIRNEYRERPYDPEPIARGFISDPILIREARAKEYEDDN